MNFSFKSSTFSIKKKVEKSTIKKYQIIVLHSFAVKCIINISKKDQIINYLSLRNIYFTFKTSTFCFKKKSTIQKYQIIILYLYSMCMI